MKTKIIESIDDVERPYVVENPEAGLLFLDVDGVLNQRSLRGGGLRRENLDPLLEIIQEVDPTVVVTSMRRESPEDLQRLADVLAPARFGPHTTVSKEKSPGGIYLARERWKEIADWLVNSTYTSPEPVVILDDIEDMGPFQPNLAKTNPLVGLTDELAQEVIRRFKEGRESIQRDHAYQWRRAIL